MGISDVNSSTGGVLLSNSSDDALEASGGSDTFTGQFINVAAYSSIVVACKTDRDGTLYVDFSPDGSNQDSSLSYAYAAGVNEVHRITITRKYARVRFVNTSAQAQSYFRLQTLIGSQFPLTSNLNSQIQSDADTLVVRPLDFNLLVAEGLYQKRTNTIKDGINFDVDSGSVPEDVTNEGGVYAGFPNSAAAAEIVIAGADTGTVYYSYMATPTDEEYTFGSKAVTGAGTYALGHNIWRCNFSYYVDAVNTDFNAGDITVRLTATPATVFCVIAAGYSQSYCAAYTVPYNSSVYIDRITGNMRGSATGAMDGVFWYRPYGESPRLRFPFELQFGTLYFDDVDYLIKIPALTDIVPRITTSSANNLVAKVSYRLIKVRS